MAAISTVVIVWSTFLVISRSGVQSGMTIFDIAALRYSIAGLICVPIVIYYKPWRSTTVTRLATILFAIPAALLITSAIAATPSPTCSLTPQDPKLAIAACTLDIIASSRVDAPSRTNNEARAVHHFVRGSWYEETGQWKKSIADYDSALSLTVDTRLSPLLFLYRGQAKARLGDMTNALIDMDRAIELNSSIAQAYAIRGQTLSELGRDVLAIADFDAAIRLDPTAPKHFLVRANHYERRNEITLAVADYTVVIRLDPRNAHALLIRGGLLASRGELENAIQDMDRSILIDPHQPLAYYTRGLAKEDLQRHEEALSDYGEAIRLDPESLPALGRRARLLRLSGDLVGAMADLDRAIDLSPYHIQALGERAVIHGIMGNYEQALADLKIAIASAPSVPGLRNNQGIAYRSLGDHARAIASFDNAIELAPDDLKPMRDKGVSQFSLGDFTAAATTFDSADLHANDFGQAALWRYITHARLGNQDKTILTNANQRFDPRGWPGPIILALLGTPIDDSILANQKDVRRLQKGDIEFFRGQIALLDGDKETARRHFEATVSLSVAAQPVYPAAKAELDRLD